MRMIKSVFIFLFLCLSGCSDIQHSDKNSVKKNSFVNRRNIKKIREAKDLDDLFVLKNIVHLETRKESLIGEIERLIFLPDKKRIIILDSYSAKRIFLFDEEGNFLTRIGKIGSGPGEYTQPRAIACEDNKLIVYSWPPSKLLFYSLEGKYIKEILFATKDWQFRPDEMALLKGDLYIYTNNPDYRKAGDGKAYRVFRLKNGTRFLRAYGSPEKTFHFGDGDIIAHQQTKIIYSGIFDGNIYEIDPASKTDAVLLSLGALTDLNKVQKHNKPLQFILSNLNTIDSIVQLGVIKNILFIERHNVFSLATTSGKLLRKNLPKDLKLPSDFDSYASRLGLTFYNNGIIIPATLKSRIKENDVLNPSLILFELDIE